MLNKRLPEMRIATYSVLTLLLGLTSSNEVNSQGVYGQPGMNGQSGMPKNYPAGMNGGQNNQGMNGMAHSLTCRAWEGNRVPQCLSKYGTAKTVMRPSARAIRPLISQSVHPAVFEFRVTATRMARRIQISILKRSDSSWLV